MGFGKDGEEKKGGHIVLVHGACHGAWCWYKLSALLNKAGHRVTAIDLTASGTSPVDAEEVRTWSHNNEPLLHFFNALHPDDKVILVGHSMGGMNLTCIMEQFPDKIAAAVFLAAFMPLSGTSVMQLLNEVEVRIGSWGDTEFNYGRGPHNPPTTFKLGKHFSRQRLYQNSPSQDIALAETKVRKHPLCEGDVVYTSERYGRVRRVYIVAKEDDVIWEELQRKMIADNPPDQVYDIEGSDHSPFFCNPTRLADILVDILNVNPLESKQCSPHLQQRDNENPYVCHKG